MILTDNTMRQFWNWWHSEPILKRYKYFGRHDMYNHNIKDKWFADGGTVVSWLNESKHKLSFMSKSTIEKNTIIIDFFFHIGIVIDVQPFPSYPEEVNLDDIFNENFDDSVVTLLWFPNVFDFPLSNNEYEVGGGNDGYYDDKYDAQKAGILFVNDLINNKSKQNETGV